MSINDVFGLVRIVSVISNSFERNCTAPPVKRHNHVPLSFLFKNLWIFPKCIVLTDCVHKGNPRVKQAKECGARCRERKSEREQRKRKKNIVLLVTRLRTQLFAHTMYKLNLCVPSTTYYLSITRDHRPSISCARRSSQCAQFAGHKISVAKINHCRRRRTHAWN